MLIMMYIYSNQLKLSLAHAHIGKWLVRIFVRSIGQRRTEEVAIISKDTKGARYAVSSSTGMELSAPAVRGH
jgi:hypothetical protein